MTLEVKDNSALLQNPQELTKTHDYVLKVFRVLIADLVQQFGGGHPGGAMGMAAIGIALWKYVLKFSPNDAKFFNRDRFVLSNGHTCLFQYAFHHLVGYKHMTLEQLKTYHSADLNSYCPGHPENEHPAIEITTGALGQGVANAVGLAIAAKNLAAKFNRPGYPVVSNHTFCLLGDACLQEGVALEAVSLAGHLGLNNLTLICDYNQVTCDGSVDLTNTENIKEKFAACNWNVIEIQDGSNDVLGIVDALETSRNSKDKPTFIIAYTTIGIGSSVEGTAAAHGAAFGQEDVDRLHREFDMDVEDRIKIPDSVYDFFGDLKDKGDSLIEGWNHMVEQYKLEFPTLGQDFERRVKGELADNWESLIPSEFPPRPTPSRKSGGLAFNPIAEKVDNFIVGTADLSPSVNLTWNNKLDFQNPNINTRCGINGNYSGRFLHYGVREHAMVAISNGIAAYNKGTFIPVTSTFFMFYLYAAPAVRYGALSHLQVIHVATHDSIGIGEDGPTHQPIELAALYRAMPNLAYIRPCDSEETAGAWEWAIKAKDTPTILSFSRHSLDQFPQYSRRDAVKLGAYVFKPEESPDINIIGTGSEMKFAVEASNILQKRGIKSRVISFPSQTLFEHQDTEYKQSILQRGKLPTIVIEAYAPNGWERYATAGISMHTFGKSLPGPITYKYFGYDSETIADKIQNYYSLWKHDDSLKYIFQDLNRQCSS